MENKDHIKVIPGYARYGMDIHGKVHNNGTGNIIAVTMKKVEDQEVPHVRLTDDNGKRVFVSTEKIYNDLYQSDIEGKTKPEGDASKIKKAPREVLVTREIAAAIRKEKSEEGTRNKDLAVKFGIHPSTVSNIIHNRKYVFND